MQLLVNDLSVHGQFPDLDKFRDALGRIMTIREVAKRYERELHCHRSFSSTRVASDGMPLSKAVPRVLSKDGQRAVMRWLDQSGPFWDAEREHGDDDYIECRGQVVTETAVGEAAYRCLHGDATSLVSLIPSCWNFSPVDVLWRKSDEDTEAIRIDNYRKAEVLEEALRAALPLIASWGMLEDRLKRHCPQLTFLPDCFESLRAHPFSRPTAQAIYTRLQVLEQLQKCSDAEGGRTVEGDRLYKMHFQGDRAWFSDSTRTEKNDFRAEMTFPHPDIPREYLFCPWHGKVNYPHFPIRIHFSWPVSATELLYVAYVGPKITRR